MAYEISGSKHNFHDDLKTLHIISKYMGFAPFTIMKKNQTTIYKITKIDIFISIVHVAICLSFCGFVTDNYFFIVKYFQFQATVILRTSFIMVTFCAIILVSINLINFGIQHKTYFNVLLKLINVKECIINGNQKKKPYNTKKFLNKLFIFITILYLIASCIQLYQFAKNSVIYMFTGSYLIYMLGNKLLVFCFNIIMINEFKQLYMQINIEISRILCRSINENKYKYCEIIYIVSSCVKNYAMLCHARKYFDKYFAVNIIQRFIMSLVTSCTTMMVLILLLNENSYYHELNLILLTFWMIEEIIEIFLILFWISSTVSAVCRNLNN